MTATSVLISGAGIAGPTLAWWLQRAGFAPTLVERAPAPRTGGYIIDFWGLGYDIAERMGLADDLQRAGYRIRELRIVDAHGTRIAGFGTRVLRDLTGGRFVSIRRSDLAALLFARIRDCCQVRFGDEITGLVEDPEGVEVRFERSPSARFDLVIGADGQHSQVRTLAFGARVDFEVPLGSVVAAFETQGYRPRDDDTYVMYNDPGRMLARCALRDDRTLFLYIFREHPQAPLPLPDHDPTSQKLLITRHFCSMGWEAPQSLAALAEADDLYLDRVSQIRMPRWSKGRIALVGDAAFCASLMAGQGSALAMTAAYVLAGELAQAGARYQDGFDRYERRLRRFLDAKQRAARGFASAFAPNTRFGLRLRNAVIRATAIPGLARLALGRDLTDRLTLPEYSWPPDRNRPSKTSDHPAS